MILSPERGAGLTDSWIAVIHDVSRVADMSGERRFPSRPNQSMEPTATAVTHPADAGCAPAVAVAHH